MTPEVGFSSPVIIFLRVKSIALVDNIWDWKKTHTTIKYFVIIFFP